MRSNLRPWLGFLAALVLLAAFAAAAQDDAEERPAPPRIHAERLDDSALAVRRMFLLEDFAALPETLRTMQEACRELQPEERDVYGSDVRSLDLGLHTALDRTRELVSDGHWEAAERQYEWVLRACTNCHQKARERGFGPPQPVR